MLHCHYIGLDIIFQQQCYIVIMLAMTSLFSNKNITLPL